MGEKQRIIVGISGASGIIYGIRLLQALKNLAVETHLVITKSAERTRGLELTAITHKELIGLADYYYPIQDIGAAIASGSFKTLGMIIAPCSMRSLAEVATGVTSNLLTRAADVILKERRRLVLLVRETPLHTGNIKNMLTVSEYGGIIFPPVPAFYINPKNLDDIINHTVGRALDLFGLTINWIKRWGED